MNLTMTDELDMGQEAFGIGLSVCAPFLVVV